MINGKTVEEYNAWQRQRGYIVSRLHGYEAMEEGDSVESLKADYLALTGEPYRTRAEETADLVAAAEVRGKEHKAAQERIDRTQIADAKDRGFRDCNEVFDMLGIPEINAGGIRRSKFQVATRYILEAGVKLAVIIEAGYTDVPKGERSGCWGTDLPQVINYLAAKEAKREHAEWDAAYYSAVNNRALYGNSGNMDWDVYIDSLGPEPPQPDFDPVTVKAAGEERREAETNDGLAAAVQSYAGEFNKFDLPRFRQFREHIWKEAGVRIKRRQIAGLWGKR